MSEENSNEEIIVAVLLFLYYSFVILYIMFFHYIHTVDGSCKYVDLRGTCFSEWQYQKLIKQESNMTIEIPSSLSGISKDNNDLVKTFQIR